MRTFVVIGKSATSSPSFHIEDVPGTSGRIDVLLRCVRAAILVSHGLRRDTRLYLVLLGGPPRTIRLDGATAEFMRPDERQVAIRVQKTLATPSGEGWTVLRHGWSIADGGLEVVLADLGKGDRFVLDEGGADLRSTQTGDDAIFFVGDHLGLDVAPEGATKVSLGPRSIHAEDAIAIVHNELDRRAT